MKIKTIITALALPSLLLFTPVSNAELSVTARQIADPTQMTEVEVSPARTEVIVSSWRDMNSIETPFERPKVITNATVDVKVDGMNLYFTPKEKSKPFGLFITDETNPKAPRIKLNIIATDLPVGAQIKLKLEDDTYELDTIAKKKGAPSSYIEPMLKTFHLLGQYHPHDVPEGIKALDVDDQDPVFFGNTLLILDKRYRTPLFVIDAYTATNRANDTVTLVAADFLANKTDPDTDIANSPNNSVAFYPKNTLLPGESTTVFLMRARK